MKLAEHKMPCDVSTRWNSTFDMLDFALQYRAAIDDLTSNKTAGLCQYEISDEEWCIADQLHNALKVCLLFPIWYPFSHTCTVRAKVFKDATLFFSRSTPNLATVIPAMDHIDEVLTTSSLDNMYSPSICAALSIGKKTLNHYYDATDQSEVYRIAMSEYICMFYDQADVIWCHCSSSPPAQTQILRESGLGT